MPGERNKLTSTESRAHSVSAVDLAQLHTTYDEARYYLASPLDDGIFGGIHIQTPHAAKLLDLLHRYETLNGKGPEWTIMSRGRDDDGSIDGVRVHARLIIMMHGDQGPVGDHSSDADGTIWQRASDKILDCRGVEQFDVGECQNLGEESRGEECLWEC